MKKIEIAKALSSFKKDCINATNENKAVNIRTIVNVMKAIGIYVEEKETFEIIETGKNANGNPFSRREKTGKGVKFQLGEEVYYYDSNKQYSAYSLTCKLATINVLELAKYF